MRIWLSLRHLQLAVVFDRHAPNKPNKARMWWATLRKKFLRIFFLLFVVLGALKIIIKRQAYRWQPAKLEFRVQFSSVFFFFITNHRLAPTVPLRPVYLARPWHFFWIRSIHQFWASHHRDFDYFLLRLIKKVYRSPFSCRNKLAAKYIKLPMISGIEGTMVAAPKKNGMQNSR